MKPDSIEHTPTPWTVERSGRDNIIRGADGTPVAMWATDCADPINTGDANYIVRCVNAFPDLLDACEAALDMLTDFGKSDSNGPITSHIKAAIAKARGES